MRLLRSLAAAALLAAPLLAGPVGPSDAAPAGVPSYRGGHVLERLVIGHSVRGREILAWHLANGETGRRAGPTVVLVSAMHGNEPAPKQLLTALRTGPLVHGVDLWLVPTYNPDGLAARSRRNAHGVDLNRNYPYGWVDLDGSYESGPRPASEPETRAMMRFLERVDPDYVLSFHQPLHGVDTDNERPGFSRHVARTLHLPATRLDCGGVCHGTMTGWFNHRSDGFALTVEYGARPGRALMRRTAPRQVLEVFDAWRGSRPAGQRQPG